MASGSERSFVGVKHHPSLSYSTASTAAGRPVWTASTSPVTDADPPSRHDCTNERTAVNVSGGRLFGGALASVLAPTSTYVDGTLKCASTSSGPPSSVSSSASVGSPTNHMNVVDPSAPASVTCEPSTSAP